MKFKSPVYSEASGSIAGLVYSHNRGGMYTRARATPTNPATAQQQAIRSAVATLDNRWVNVLTAAQRVAWETYALNTLMLDRLGEPRNVGGIGMYVRGNVPRSQSGITEGIIDAGPTTFGLPDLSTVGATVSEATQQISATFDTGDDWVGEDGAALLVYASRPQNPTINYFKGPYRLAGSVEGDSVTPPTSPQTIGVPFAVVQGQRVFVRAVMFRADARLSPEQFLTVDVGA